MKKYIILGAVIASIAAMSLCASAERHSRNRCDNCTKYNVLLHNKSSKINV